MYNSVQCHASYVLVMFIAIGFRMAVNEAKCKGMLNSHYWYCRSEWGFIILVSKFTAFCCYQRACVPV